MIPDLQQPQMHSAIITGIGTAAAAGLALGGWAYASLWPASRIFGEALIAPKRPLELALTFDDGPNPEWTPPLLDILARSEIQATFFLIGKYAAAQPALVREIQSAGHLIGNHTWTHPNLAVTDPKRTRQELLQAIWGERSFQQSRTLDSHACRLRQKLAAVGAPHMIQNVWGVGYQAGTGV